MRYKIATVAASNLGGDYVSCAIITKVKNIIHNRYVFAECKLKLDGGWDRTILVDWGEDRNNDDGRSLRRFRREDVIVFDNSILLPQLSLSHGIQYLLDLYDNNVPSELKEMIVYPYFLAARQTTASKFNDRAHSIWLKNIDLRRG